MINEIACQRYVNFLELPYNKALAIAEREPWMQVDFDREAVRRRVESLQRPGSEPK